MNLIGSIGIAAVILSSFAFSTPACAAPSALAQARLQWRVRMPQIYAGLVFSPDGRTLAAGGDEGGKPVIHLRDARTWRVRTTLRGFGLGISALAISRDGRLVATAIGINNPRYGEVSSGPIQLWDGRTGKLLRTLRPMRRVDFIVYALAFSPDGRTLASGGGDTLMRLWDVHTGRERRVMPFGGYVNALAFSPDGKKMAAGGTAEHSGHEQVHMWGLPGMKTVLWTRLTNRHRYPENLSRIQFSPDGRRLLTPLSLWDCRERRLLFDFSTLLRDENDDFLLPAFTPSGRVRGIVSRGVTSPGSNIHRFRLISLDTRTLRLSYGRSLGSDLSFDWLNFSPGARDLLGYSMESQALESFALD